MFSWQAPRNPSGKRAVHRPPWREGAFEQGHSIKKTGNAGGKRGQVGRAPAGKSGDGYVGHERPVASGFRQPVNTGTEAASHPDRAVVEAARFRDPELEGKSAVRRPCGIKDHEGVFRVKLTEEPDRKVKVLAADPARSRTVGENLWVPCFKGIEGAWGQEQGGKQPHWSSLRSCSRTPSAQETAASLTESRVPPNRQVPDVVRGPLHAAIHTVPTGFSRVPPEGPAIPVTETPQWVPNTSRTPRAMATATSPLTAPLALMSCSGTPRRRVFDALE